MIRRPPRSTLFPLHDALPISVRCPEGVNEAEVRKTLLNEFSIEIGAGLGPLAGKIWRRSEEHTSELQSQSNLVCRLLLEKKKKKKRTMDRNLNMVSHRYLQQE